MGKIIHETVTRGWTAGFAVRVWRDQPGPGTLSKSNDDIRNMIGAMENSRYPSEVINALSTLPRVVAIEVSEIGGDREAWLWYDWD